jgi:hypothetical protein
MLTPRRAKPVRGAVWPRTTARQVFRACADNAQAPFFLTICSGSGDIPLWRGTEGARPSAAARRAGIILEAHGLKPRRDAGQRKSTLERDRAPHPQQCVQSNIRPIAIQRRGALSRSCQSAPAASGTDPVTESESHAPQISFILSWLIHKMKRKSRAIKPGKSSREASRLGDVGPVRNEPLSGLAPETRNVAMQHSSSGIADMRQD